MSGRAGKTVLALNGGSSSLKFAAYAVGGAAPRLRGAGSVEPIGASGATLRIQSGGGAPPEERVCDARDPRALVPEVFAALENLGVSVHAVGHRIVHGGPRHERPERVDAPLLASLREAIDFAPLHLPGELALIEAVSAHAPGLPQAVCFDTAFHARMPLAARRLPVPTTLWTDGVRRYGFHGLSYESILHSLGRKAAGRLIVAHLGNGASMAAIHDGQPRDTTMGFTPCGGLVMGTRTGDLDPGVVVFLARTRGMDPDALEDLLNRRSGLLALSETTHDMEALLAARASDPRAVLAVAQFCDSARKWIGALAAGLGGLDTLVFTGGMGEKAPAIREQICRGLGFLGIGVDAARNAASEAVISEDGGRVTVRVVPTHEEIVIALHTAEVLFGGGAAGRDPSR